MYPLCGHTTQNGLKKESGLPDSCFRDSTWSLGEKNMYINKCNHCYTFNARAYWGPQLGKDPDTWAGEMKKG